MKRIKWGNIILMILLIISCVLLVKSIIKNNNETNVNSCNWSEDECKIFEEHKYDMQKYLEK